MKSHTKHFFLHFRPRSYPRISIAFNNTFYLGSATVFLLLVELITGVFLLVYYIPTSGDAYASILNIVGYIPFGAIVRDLHRLSGELMIITTCLHLIRVYLSGAYKKRRRFTWVTGIVLLFFVIGLAFTGYLLPWDQRAYWAVTIGTSMIESIPIIGHTITLLVRGAPAIGNEGLLRFYMLHVFMLPFAFIVFLGIHYYRVSRLHGISLPVDAEISTENSDKNSNKKLETLPFLPDIWQKELFLSGIFLFILLGSVCFFYDAPLENHANPRLTPLNTQAPWFFLWFQGLLKLGDKTIMGIWIPWLFMSMLLFFPYLSKSRRQRLKDRPVALAVLSTGLCLFIGLSIYGSHYFGIHLPANEEIFQNLIPDKNNGPIRKIPFDDLNVGIHISNQPESYPKEGSVQFFFNTFVQTVNSALYENRYRDAIAILIIEDWQLNVKRLTLRIIYNEPGPITAKTLERKVIVHRLRSIPKFEILK